MKDIRNVVRDLVGDHWSKARKKEKKQSAERKYKETIEKIYTQTGKPIAPKVAKVYRIVKPMEKKLKKREKNHGKFIVSLFLIFLTYFAEVLLSKFHKSTTLEDIKLFLENIGTL